MTTKTSDARAPAGLRPVAVPGLRRHGGRRHPDHVRGHAARAARAPRRGAVRGHVGDPGRLQAPRPRRWTRRRSASCAEETGVDAASLLTQFGAYGDPGRDPRMNVVTVGVPRGASRRRARSSAGTDAADAALMPVSDVLNGKLDLAFDHLRIVRDAIERVRVELEVSGIATAFVGTDVHAGRAARRVRGHLGRAARRRELPAQHPRRGRLGDPDRPPSAARLRPAAGPPSSIARDGRGATAARSTALQRTDERK